MYGETVVLWYWRCLGDLAGTERVSCQALTPKLSTTGHTQDTHRTITGHQGDQESKRGTDRQADRAKRGGETRWEIEERSEDAGEARPRSSGPDPNGPCKAVGTRPVCLVRVEIAWVDAVALLTARGAVPSRARVMAHL